MTSSRAPAAMLTMGSDESVPWRRLHPASLLVNLIPTAWRTLQRVWPLLLAMVFSKSITGLVDLILVASFFALAAVRTVLHFATLRYRFAHGRLEIQQGLISRVEQALDPARIQNVSLEQNVFHRMAGLVELRIEMAGAGSAPVDGMLSALSIPEAEALRKALGRTGAAVDAQAADVDVIDAVGLLEVVGYGVSAGRVGAAVVAIGLFLDVANQVSPGALPVQNLGRHSWAGLMLVALAGGYTLSAGGAILRFYRFRWWQSGGDFHFESGLLTRRRMDIPIRKLQLVQITEPIVRRAMGFATMLFETAAAAVPEAGGSAEALVPMVAREDVVSRVRAAFPRLDTPIDGDLLPCAPRAVGRAVLRGVLGWLGPAAGAAFWFGTPWAWLLLGLGGGMGMLDARRQGWRVTERFIVVRRGFLSRDTWVLPREKVQSVHWVQGPIARAAGLARLVVWFPGGRLPLPEIGEVEARALFASLRPTG